MAQLNLSTTQVLYTTPKSQLTTLVQLLTLLLLFIMLQHQFTILLCIVPHYIMHQLPHTMSQNLPIMNHQSAPLTTLKLGV